MYLYVMKITLTESDIRHVILESAEKQTEKTIENVKKYTKDLYEKVKDHLGLNLKFLLTWGVGIGALISPIESWINENVADITPMEVTLIAISAVMTVFFEKKADIKVLLDRIKEEGLSDTFSTVVKKTKELKKSFKKLLEYLGVGLSGVASMANYAFMLPLIPIMKEVFIRGDFEEVELDKMVTRLIGIGVSAAVAEVIKKLASRISKL
jgi:uncharacterized alkaline shock family protein YloU